MCRCARNIRAHSQPQKGCVSGHTQQASAAAFNVRVAHRGTETGDPVPVCIGGAHKRTPRPATPNAQRPTRCHTHTHTCAVRRPKTNYGRVRLQQQLTRASAAINLRRSYRHNSTNHMHSLQTHQRLSIHNRSSSLSTICTRRRHTASHNSGKTTRPFTSTAPEGAPIAPRGATVAHPGASLRLQQTRQQRPQMQRARTQAHQRHSRAPLVRHWCARQPCPQTHQWCSQASQERPQAHHHSRLRCSMREAITPRTSSTAISNLHASGNRVAAPAPLERPAPWLLAVQGPIRANTGAQIIKHARRRLMRQRWQSRMRDQSSSKCNMVRLCARTPPKARHHARPSA